MENIDKFSFFLVSLAVWRVASLFAREEGIFDIFFRFKLLFRVNEVGTDQEHGTNWFNRGLICVWCNSIWFATIGALLFYTTLDWYIVHVLTLSTLAIFYDSILYKE